MFGLFRPSCPCDPAAKVWVEERLAWLSNEFVSSAFTDLPIVLPTAEFFPDSYDGSRDDARSLLDRVCGYMGVVPELVEPRFERDSNRLWLVDQHGDAIGGAAGTYGEGERKHEITIGESGLPHPMGLVGTMAHELAHVLLMGEGRVDPEAFDNELLTDLTVVHLGLGIFLANTPRNWPADYSRWPGTDLLKPAYMTPPMFGWALAHLAWFRGQDRPPWTKHLTWDARTNLKQGLRYIARTGDSGYRPDWA